MPNITIRNIKYTSSKLPLWLNVLTALFLIFFLSLASWQTYRGLSKQQLLNNLQAGKESTSLTSAQLTTDGSIQTYQIGQPVMLQGELDNERYFLLENKIMHGKAGYYVIQPLKISPRTHILINRGWIPKPIHNQGAISIAPIHKMVTIKGHLYEPKHNVFISKNMMKHDWPQRALEVNFKEFEKRLGYPILPKLVNCDPDSEVSFMPVPALESWLTPERHYGYAFQWLSFALILCGIWTVKRFGFWRKKHDRNDTRPS